MNLRRLKRNLSFLLACAPVLLAFDNCSEPPVKPSITAISAVSAEGLVASESAKGSKETACHSLTPSPRLRISCNE